LSSRSPVPPVLPPISGGYPSHESAMDLNDLREYLLGIRKRWKLVVLVIVLAVLVAMIQYSITPPVYQATALLQIERRNPASVVTTQAPWLENLWNMEYYPTQYKLLQSRGMAERVVRDLRLDEDPRFNRLAGTDREGRTADDDRAVLAAIANRVRAGLAVEPDRGTQLVRVIYRSSKPELAAELANIDWGIETQSGRVGKASDFLGEQIDALKQEVADRERQIQLLSQQEKALTFNPDSSVTTQRLQSLNEEFMEAKRRRIEKEARYKELGAEPDRTVADLGSGGAIDTVLRDQLRLERDYETKLKTYKPDWPAMIELKAEIDKGRQHLDGLMAREADRIRQSAQAEYQAALRQERSLEGEIEELKRQMLDNSSVAVQYNNLQVEVSTRRDLLDELLRRQSETEVALRIQSNRESNVRVVDEALVPPAPYHPSLRRMASMGLAAGLLLGLGGALLLEFLDRTLKNADEVERLLGLPVLGVIPDLADSRTGKGNYGYGYGRRTEKARRTRGGSRHRRDKGGSGAEEIELIPHTRPRLAVSEAYRSLRTALLLSTAEGLRTVTVTSAGAGEGKTVTAANLAVVMAQLGRKVLLVDADLRKPRLHRVFNLSNRTGLVHALTGSAELDDTLQRTSVADLWVTPAGPTPPNPSELLASARMGDLLQIARTRFDLVIFDTPPVLAVTDAILVGAQSDGVVLCLRAGQVVREDARNCLNRLTRVEIKVLGAVLNGFKPQAGRYGRSDHYYEAYVATLEDSSSSAG
jgi:succinoglycan biosynthesis transport protein ExoP